MLEFFLLRKAEYHRYHLDISVIFTTKLMTTVCMRRMNDFSSPGIIVKHSYKFCWTFFLEICGRIHSYSGSGAENVSTTRTSGVITLAEAAVKPLTVWKNTFQNEQIHFSVEEYQT